MHKYRKNKLPFSFNETWTFNINRNPDLILRNAHNYFVPAHHFSSVKRFPLFIFPRAWNEEDERKLNPSLSFYCKQLKIALLSSIND
jgi:hypothetical protein